MSNLVCARTYGTKEEAELARGILESNGIHATVSADDIAGWAHALDFQVELQVLDTDLEEAKQILDYFHKDEVEDEDEESPVGWSDDDTTESDGQPE